MAARWQRLQDLAIRQRGHFTTAQAEAQALTRAALHYQLREGRLTRPERRVYRFTAYPSTANEREAVIMLWSRLDPVIALSHETALKHFELGDAFPKSTTSRCPARSACKRYTTSLSARRN